MHAALDHVLDQPDRLPRHKLSDLQRGGTAVLDEAARTGVVLDATPTAPEFVPAPSAEWDRLRELAVVGRIMADVLSDLAALGSGERRRDPHIPWLAALNDDDLRQFALDVAAARLSLATNNPEPLRQALYAWRSTAEYVVAGERLSGPIDWEAVARLARPRDAED